MRSKIYPEGYEIVIESVFRKEISLKDITLAEIEKLYYDDKTKSTEYVVDDDSSRIKVFYLYEAVKKIKKANVSNYNRTRYKNSYRERMKKCEQEWKEMRKN